LAAGNALFGVLRLAAAFIGPESGSKLQALRCERDVVGSETVAQRRQLAAGNGPFGVRRLAAAFIGLESGSKLPHSKVGGIDDPGRALSLLHRSNFGKAFVTVDR
jgi:hypothetical protein